MVSLCFYFQVHQPFRVRKYSIFDVGKNDDYFGGPSDDLRDNIRLIRKVSEKSYLPANAVLLELLNKYPEFKIAFSFSGVLLEQLELYAPEVLESFQKLVDTGRVEVLSETYYHSLAFMYSRGEFREQVRLHRELIERLFGVTPTVFRNTELTYTNDLAREVEAMGFKGILAEGWHTVLGWRSPNFVYKPVSTKSMPVLTKNYKLSDDVAFRFSNKGWEEWPLDVGKYLQWINAVNGNGETVNLFMDYETFGEHQWEDTGIFDFLRHLPGEFLKHPDNDFKTPSEVIDTYEPRGEFDVPFILSWADMERDLSAWVDNDIQKAAIAKVYALGHRVLRTKNEALIHVWRKLQTSDHFYYMCTKYFNDGDVHKYFSPYDSPYDAFISYMNVLQDLELRLEQFERLREKERFSVSSFVRPYSESESSTEAVSEVDAVDSHNLYKQSASLSSTEVNHGF